MGKGTPIILYPLGGNATRLVTGASIGYPISTGGGPMYPIAKFSLQTAQQIMGLVHMFPCGYQDCRATPQNECWYNKVFGVSGYPTSSYSNDTSNFYANAPSGTVVTFSIQKNTNYWYNPSGGQQWQWNTVENVINNNSGQYSPMGSIPGMPNYANFNVNWGLVLRNYGPGFYKIIVNNCLLIYTQASLSVIAPATTTPKKATCFFTTVTIPTNGKSGTVTASFSNGQTTTITVTTGQTFSQILSALITSINTNTVFTASGSATLALTAPIGTSYNGTTCTISKTGGTNFLLGNTAGLPTEVFAGASGGTTVNLVLGTYTIKLTPAGTQAQNAAYIAAMINASGYPFTATATAVGVIISGINGAAQNGTKVYYNNILQGTLTRGGTSTSSCNCELESVPFQLMAWDCVQAHGTVKFEMTKTGTIGDINSKGILQNVTTFTVTDSIRFPGFFGYSEFNYDELLLEYGTNNSKPFGTIVRVHDKIVEGYKLFTNYLPLWLHRRFAAYALMSDTLLVSDYNINNSNWELNRIPVVKKDNYKPEYLDDKTFDSGYNSLQRRSKATIQFLEGIQSGISNNC